MPTPYEAKFVKCPFYCKHDSNRIVCEGICEESNINITYQSKADRDKYMKKVCYDLLGCRDCPIHIMLSQLYEDDGYG